jgi:hypothetical protein
LDLFVPRLKTLEHHAGEKTARIPKKQTNPKIEPINGFRERKCSYDLGG